MKFEVKGIVQEKDVPASRYVSQYDYSELFDRFSRISAGSAIHVEVDIKKPHLAENIRNAFKKKFRSDQFKLTTRTDKAKGVINVYIIQQ